MQEHEHYGITLLKSLFTSSEIESIRKFKFRDRRHPLERLMFPQERDMQGVENIRWALVNILDKDRQWALNQKARLLASDDYSHAASALAEIRAYGFLLRAELPVKPFPKQSSSTPDFLIDEDDGKVFIEVYSKQWEKDEVVVLQRFYEEEHQFNEGERVSVKMHFSTPFGEPKGKHENVTMNAIHKLAQVKQESEGKQFSGTHTSILWLDFHDENWKLIINARDAQPVKTWNEEFFSGIIWYAFYGWKGAPIFEKQTMEERPKNPVQRMPHVGRFNQDTNIDAVIISFPRETIILENHLSKKTIKPQLWRKLFLLTWFDFGYSYINWPKSNLKQRIELQRETLDALSQEAIYSW